MTVATTSRAELGKKRGCGALVGGPGAGIQKAATACQAIDCILVRYGRYRALHTTEAEDTSFRVIADAAARYGVAVVDHLVVVP